MSERPCVENYVFIQEGCEGDWYDVTGIEFVHKGKDMMCAFYNLVYLIGFCQKHGRNVTFNVFVDDVLDDETLELFIPVLKKMKDYQEIVSVTILTHAVDDTRDALKDDMWNNVKLLNKADFRGLSILV